MVKCYTGDMVKKILHVEGLAFFTTAVIAYYVLNGNWILFILLLFVPDFFMVGYLKNKKLGSMLYNFGHTYMLGLLIVSGGLLLGQNTIIYIGVIFFAHVGLDRFLGYGLKYASGFKDTHLQRV
jgi:hypothetical protein